MRKTTCAAITAAVVILAGVAVWATPSNHALQLNASTPIGAQIDTFEIMASAKGLPADEFRDFSLVF